MEKLLKLLNEYRPAEENCSYELYDKWVDIKKQTPQIWYVENTYAEGSVIENQTLYFISKKGGFIKWLVDNDKIGRDKMLKENGLFRKYFYDLEYLKNYDRLVMWLSVSDAPIDDLIKLLKQKWSMWELLQKLEKLGWKPYGKSIAELTETEKNVRLLTSRSSGLWQFCVNNRLVRKDRFTWMISPDPLGEDQYDYTDYRYRIIESALCDESELEDFLLSNIKIEG